jgi:hypothetical protein
MAKATTDIRSLARSHTESALRVLVGIMLQPKAPAAARVAAASALLDRGWGKPAQTVNSTVSRVDPGTFSDAELADIAAETEH